MFDRLNTLFASVTSRLYAQEEGQAMVEYAFVLAIVVGIAVAALTTGLGAAITSKLNAVGKSISG
jgi:Flp pilus assembly pilin Flp